ncbi:hypothetical protein SDC9_95240 [bioreactor metagenome]|uniref:Uncharacterized protein n=1 Tax=bioreactor metagenome TaxID=1076179 RepID=A0A645A5Q2_9ZZZZ
MDNPRIAPLRPESQREIAVFGNGHPVAHNLNGVDTVLRIVFSPQIRRHRFRTDTVYPVHVYRLVVSAAWLVHFFVVYQRPHFFFPKG